MRNKALIVAGIAALSLINSPKIDAQKIDSSEAVIENFEEKGKMNIDSAELSHEEVINMNVDSLIKKFGKKKGLEIINEHMLIEINKIREKHGLSELESNDQLNKISQKYTEYMFKNNYIGHTDLDGKSAADRAKEQSYTFKVLGENLLDGAETIKEAIDLWRGSTAHMDVILEKNNKDGHSFKKIGIGYKDHIFVNNFSD